VCLIAALVQVLVAHDAVPAVVAVAHERVCASVVAGAAVEAGRVVAVVHIAAAQEVRQSLVVTLRDVRANQTVTGETRVALARVRPLSVEARRIFVADVRAVEAFVHVHSACHTDETVGALAVVRLCASIDACGAIGTRGHGTVVNVHASTRIHRGHAPDAEELRIAPHIHNSFFTFNFVGVALKASQAMALKRAEAVDASRVLCARTLIQDCALVDVRLACDACVASRAHTSVRVLTIDAVSSILARVVFAIVVTIYHTTESLIQAVRVRGPIN
jgi:hypothetical protein